MMCLGACSLNMCDVSVNVGSKPPMDLAHQRDWRRSLRRLGHLRTGDMAGEAAAVVGMRGLRTRPIWTQAECTYIRSPKNMGHCVNQRVHHTLYVALRPSWDARTRAWLAAGSFLMPPMMEPSPFTDWTLWLRPGTADTYWHEAFCTCITLQPRPIQLQVLWQRRLLSAVVMKSCLEGPTIHVHIHLWTWATKITIYLMFSLPLSLYLYI
jgi:hypothetical protein